MLEHLPGARGLNNSSSSQLEGIMSRMGSLNHVVAAVALLVLVAATTASASKADVNIFNEVGQPIRVQCKSKNNDLGEHQLLPGAKYGWGFAPNYLKNTLYWCGFGWGARTPVVLDVWRDAGFLGLRTRPCTHCEWHVRPDGFYRNEAGKTPVWVHGWN